MLCTLCAFDNILTVKITERQKLNKLCVKLCLQMKHGAKVLSFSLEPLDTHTNIKHNHAVWSRTGPRTHKTQGLIELKLNNSCTI